VLCVTFPVTSFKAYFDIIHNTVCIAMLYKGVACTNNAMEAFNATIKRSYTLGVRHTLPALFDILECLTLDVSLGIISGRKTYETIRKPPRLVPDNANKIDNTTYIVVAQNATIMQCINRQKIHEVLQTYTCPYFHKHAFCKHLIHAHGLKNTRSDKIMLEHRLKFRGNTRRAQCE
jgi:hypothetical protein